MDYTQLLIANSNTLQFARNVEMIMITHNSNNVTLEYQTKNCDQPVVEQRTMH